MLANAQMPVLMTAKQVADLTGLSLNTLQNHRVMKSGLAFVKFGNVVRYKAADVLAFIEANTIRPLR